MLSKNTLSRLAIALTSQAAGSELANAVNKASGISTIIAAHVSQTTDFSSLKVGDLVVHIPATAGNAAFEVVVTAGTKPSAAVVGDLYIVIDVPAPVSIVL
jgi:hypothetical protein